jgi:hypothetical protein
VPLRPVRPSPDDEALLYSLAEFREVIFEVLRITGSTTVVEVGSEKGTFATEMIAWLAERDGRLISIDTDPSEAVRSMAETSPVMDLEVTTSIEALGRLQPADAYLLDGDHNHFTVANELRLIHQVAGRAERPPVILAQDWSWPAGYRDQYYQPEHMPEGAAHPWSYAGVVPWEERPVSNGFRGHGNFAFALEEGGPANGVATAIDDFLAAHDGYRVRTLPCVFGLAVIFPASASWADALDAYLAPLDDHPLLRRLEANRLWLYLKVIDFQDRLDEDRRRHSDERAGLLATIETLRTSLEMARIETAGRHG